MRSAGVSAAPQGLMVNSQGLFFLPPHIGDPEPPNWLGPSGPWGSYPALRQHGSGAHKWVCPQGPVVPARRG
jgi:hypothetical protein